MCMGRKGESISLPLHLCGQFKDRAQLHSLYEGSTSNGAGRGWEEEGSGPFGPNSQSRTGTRELEGLSCMPQRDEATGAPVH